MNVCRENLPPELKISPERLAAVCERNDVAYLGLFGSYVRGDFTPKSDVDLLVRFSIPKSLLDLVTVALVSPYLKERIFGEAKCLYEKSG